MEKSEVTNIILVLTLALLLAFLYFESFYFIWGAVGLLVLNLVSFSLSSVIAKLWMKFAHIVGLFNTKVLLTVVFFVFLTPLGTIYRMFNPKQAHHFFNDTNESYFEDCPKSSKVNFLNQW